MTRAANIPTSSAAPTGAACWDVSALKNAILQLPLDDRRKLAPLFTPDAMRRAQDAERSGAFALCAAGKWGSASEIARQIRGELRIYSERAWPIDRFLPTPAKAGNAAMWRLLKLTGGEIPAERSIRRHIRELASS